MVEARAYIAAVAAADAMLKAAQVTLSGPIKKVDPGLMTVTVTGEVSAVRSAVDAGAQEAARVGELVSAHVIPRPEDGTDGLLR
ncbi:MAG: BMC domain-containing protein [Thermoleophilia bacterium]|nr:BMC domain-containing protein [Thermoleophilia bacterium]